MEEILASIRRIIESNETNGEAGRDAQFSNQFDADEEIVLDDEGDEGFAPDVAANDRGAPAYHNNPIPELHAADLRAADLRIIEPAPVPERSLSLADVAARVRAASVRQQEHASSRLTESRLPEASLSEAGMPEARMPEMRVPQLATVTELRGTISPVAEAAAPQSVSEPVRAVEAEPAPVRPSMPDFASIARPSVSRGPVAPASSAPMSAVEAPADIPAVRSPVAEALAPFASRAYDAVPVVAAEPVSVPPVDLEPARAEGPVSAYVSTHTSGQTEAAETLPARIEDAAASLLSETAGAQVAKSFNELAAVFDGLERRSVEEMAQEMLRPMLQEWLDDNLPTLVERLVREEIERVARGSRR
jgi:cell pole-organizing protein PopZ